MEMVRRTEIMQVPFDKLVIREGFNVRYDYGDIGELAESIRENGIKTPMRGFKENDKYIITDGHRRYMALDLLKEQGVDDILTMFITEPKSYNDEYRTLDLILSNEGKSLTLLEESEVYGRLVAYGWNERDIATKTGKSITHVSNCMLLMGATTKLKEYVLKGNVAASTVIEMLKKKSMEEVEQSIDDAVNAKNGRVTKKHIEQDDEELDEPKEKKPKFNLNNLVELRDKLRDVGGNEKESSFEVLEAIIDYAEGRKDLIQMGKLFFRKP